MKVSEFNGLEYRMNQIEEQLSEREAIASRAGQAPR
jgi:hypothetical protein